MHTYLIRNTNDSPMRFTTVSGDVIVLQPNEYLVYKSEKPDLHPILKKEYVNGNIDYWLDPHFLENADLVDVTEREVVEWKTQGF